MYKKLEFFEGFKSADILWKDMATDVELKNRILKFVKEHHEGVSILQIASEIAPYLTVHQSRAVEDTERLLKILEEEEYIETKYFPGPLIHYANLEE